jgi:hypothetical protein
MKRLLIATGQLLRAALVLSFPAWIQSVELQGAVVSGSFAATAELAGKTITLSNRAQIATAVVASNGTFQFPSVEVGKFDLQLSNASFRLAAPVSVTVASAADAIQLGSVAVERYAVAGSNYSYSWSQDQTYAGTEATANVVAPTVITLVGKAYKVADLSYAEELRNRYNIILVDALKAWDSEHAYRLFSTLDRLPYVDLNPYRFNAAATPTVWRLTEDFLDQDIRIETVDGVRTVTISTAAFVYAAPFVAQIEDKRGLYFSKRLHHALLRFVSNGGADTALVEGILRQRFGVSTSIPDYVALTGELPGRFQPFRPDELLQIINSFEELPEGFHVIPALKYLVRRLDGTINQKYPEASAIAWSSGYIEFMEKAFARNSEIDVQRLILHEKGHFIYGSVISPAIREAWHKLGGWYQDANGTWTTTKTTEFVSAYAHFKNPNEDFAETVAAFVTNPDILKARSTAKYEFFRDAIMFGNSYVSQIRQDLTFQVLNLFPNYNYPGKVKRVQVSVSGAPEEDKVITCEMEIQPVGPKDNPVTSIFMRVFGPKTKELPVAPYFDWYLNPIAPGSNILRGSYTLSKYARLGYWAPDQIVINDSVGNQRYERAVLYGWRCYIDNPLQDLSPPQYVANSARMSVKPGVVDGRAVQIMSMDWDVVDDRGLIAYTSSIRPPGANQYSINTWGQPFFGNGTAHTEYIITEFFPSGTYRTAQVIMKDYGLNFIYAYFTEGGGAVDGTGVRIDEPPPSISITTSNPDYEPPELDLNRISVVATPTVPDAPNGETQVVIKYLARDNKSGLGPVAFRLRDPQGIEHHFYHYHENFYGTFFKGDPVAWQQYTATVLLPVGSVPGTWGLASMDLGDKALNSKSYSFVEIVRFDPFSTAAAQSGELQMAEERSRPYQHRHPSGRGSIARLGAARQRRRHRGTHDHGPNVGGRRNLLGHREQRRRVHHLKASSAKRRSCDCTDFFRAAPGPDRPRRQHRHAYCHRVRYGALDLPMEEGRDRDPGGDQRELCPDQHPTGRRRKLHSDRHRPRRRGDLGTCGDHRGHGQPAGLGQLVGPLDAFVGRRHRLLHHQRRSPKAGTNPGGRTDARGVRSRRYAGRSAVGGAQCRRADRGVQQRLGHGAQRQRGGRGLRVCGRLRAFVRLKGCGGARDPQPRHLFGADQRRRRHFRSGALRVVRCRRRTDVDLLLSSLRSTGWHRRCRDDYGLQLIGFPKSGHLGAGTWSQPRRR